VERALEVDSPGQMIASVLSKKAAAGSTHLLVDIPIGNTAKVRRVDEAERLTYFFKVIGASLGIKVKVVTTDGSQPVGRGIGPALEAMDVLSVLRNAADAPLDLKERALSLAGEILDMSGLTVAGTGINTARQILETGRAFQKFMAICECQGGFSEPTPCTIKHPVTAERDGVISAINNRKLSRLARLAGAPRVPGAGILFLSPLGRKVKKGDALYYIYSEGSGEMNYALDFLASHTDIVVIS
jgi:thymidine phosphorylase